MEGQLENLLHSYEGWINLVAQAALPEQHQMTVSSLHVELEVPDLVCEEP